MTQDNDPQFENSLRQLIFKLNVYEINESPIVKFTHATSDLSRYLGVELDTKKYELSTPKIRQGSKLYETGQSPSDSGRLADYYARREIEPIEQLSSLTRKFVIPQSNGIVFDEDNTSSPEQGWGSRH